MAKSTGGLAYDHRLTLDAFQYTGAADKDKKNNRTRCRVNLFIDKSNINNWAYSLTAAWNSVRLRVQRYNNSNVWTSSYDTSKNFGWDTRPAGKQKVISLWAMDIWIPHKSDTTQTFRAIADLDADVIGARSLTATQALSTLGAKPTAPTGAKIAQVGSTNFRYTATQPSATPGVSAREVQVALNSGFTSGVSSFSPSSLTNVNITGRSADTLYYVRSRVQNLLGWSGWSSTISYRTETVPGAPTLINVTPGLDSISCTIVEPSYTGGGITSYRTELRDQATGALVEFKTGASTAISFTSLKRGYEYYLQVSATSAAGQGAYSDSYFVRTLGVTLSLWLYNGSPQRGGVWVYDRGAWRMGHAFVYQQSGGWKKGVPTG